MFCGVFATSGVDCGQSETRDTTNRSVPVGGENFSKREKFGRPVPRGVALGVLASGGTGSLGERGTIDSRPLCRAPLDTASPPASHEMSPPGVTNDDPKNLRPTRKILRDPLSPNALP